MTDPKIDEAKADEKATSNDFIEYKGDEKYGTEFLVSHTITRQQAKEGAWETEIPADLVWKRREGGAYKGRMLLSVDEIIPEALAALENEPGFKRVTLKR